MVPAMLDLDLCCGHGSSASIRLDAVGLAADALELRALLGRESPTYF